MNGQKRNESKEVRQVPLTSIVEADHMQGKGGKNWTRKTVGN